MRMYTVARARQRLAEVLDAAEGGDDVVIERRGVRFAVRPLARAHARSRTPRVEILDPDIESGQWSWSWDDKGMRLEHPRGRRP